MKSPRAFSGRSKGEFAQFAGMNARCVGRGKDGLLRQFDVAGFEDLTDAERLVEEAVQVGGGQESAAGVEEALSLRLDSQAAQAGEEVAHRLGEDSADRVLVFRFQDVRPGELR